MVDLNSLNNITDLLSQDESTKPIIDIIDSIMGIPDENLTEDNIDIIIGMIRGGFTPQIKKQAIDALVNGFESDGLNKNQVRDTITEICEGLKAVVEEQNPSEIKRKLLNCVVDLFYELFDAANERYHSYDIELPIKLDEGAYMPTYAHEDDAAADLYALTDMTVPAKSVGNKVHTGVYLELPENWCAHIAPRSSIGAKTSLRLSNNIGIIDPSYRGELIVLYDNISDSDYYIKAGDRIAQMWVEPVHRFKPKQVEAVASSERSEGAFGSTGR